MNFEEHLKVRLGLNPKKPDTKTEQTRRRAKKIATDIEKWLKMVFDTSELEVICGQYDRYFFHRDVDSTGYEKSGGFSIWFQVHNLVYELYITHPRWNYTGPARDHSRWECTIYLMKAPPVGAKSRHPGKRIRQTSTVCSGNIRFECLAGALPDDSKIQDIVASITELTAVCIQKFPTQIYTHESLVMILEDVRAKRGINLILD